MTRIVAAILFILLTAASAQAEMVSIAGGKVNMRSGPGTSHQVLWELGLGYPLKVIGRKGGWLQVRDFEADEGWVLGKLTSRRPFMVVQRPRVNVRQGPGTGHRLLGQAEYGMIFPTLARQGRWVKVRYDHRTEGWIRRDLLWGW
ncbi:MAG: SH3 domain-containing protein [Thermodesulfobacteriota bacterium]